MQQTVFEMGPQERIHCSFILLSETFSDWLAKWTFVYDMQLPCSKKQHLACLLFIGIAVSQVRHFLKRRDWLSTMRAEPQNKIIRGFLGDFFVCQQTLCEICKPWSTVTPSKYPKYTQHSGETNGHCSSSVSLLQLVKRNWVAFGLLHP